MRIPGVCYDCGYPAKLGEQCLRCGGFHTGSDRARVTVLPPVPEESPAAWPLTPLRWESPSVLLLSGGPGSGKTSICAILDATLYISSEQTPSAIANTFNRVRGNISNIPMIVSCTSVEQLRMILSSEHLRQDSIVIVDSLTELGTENEQTKGLSFIQTFSKTHGVRFVVVSQVNKKGQTRGRANLPHMADVTADVSVDENGLRRLTVSKNRHGDVFTAYFVNNGNGITKPLFRYCYSVEGSPGSYVLCPHPSPGAQWNGIARNHGRPGTASAARKSDVYPSGYMEPEDVETRREFAEMHGLKWLTPEAEA